MQLGCVMHRASENNCYAVNKDIIEVKIKTGYDVDSVEIVYGDPFSGGILGGDWKWDGKKEKISDCYELQHHKVWVIRFEPQFKRLKYYFVLHSKDENILFFEDGFMTNEQALTPGKVLQCFTMPWLNPIDVVTTPGWAKDTVWYQIFPDRFCRGDEGNNPNALPWASRKPKNEDVYGGDLVGIIKRLDYLKNLGINGIYLNPIFAASATHKYDTTDYYKIDAMFGDDTSFRLLMQECHNRGIRVMLDGVFNHCGSDFPQWQDVVELGEKSRYYDWFMVNEWPFDKEKHHTRDGEFYSFAFTSKMPKLNTNNPEVIEYIVQICEYWIREFDIDGWRLDVANEISHALCKQIQKRCRALKPDIYILGEIWHDSINWLLGDEFDSVMNYPLTTAITDFWLRTDMTSKQFEHAINTCYQRYMYQTNDVLFNLLDSHDTDRLYHRVKRNKNVFYQQLSILFTMAGSTSIYYGTEITMDGAHDPDCRACMPWDEIEAGSYDDDIAMMKQLIKMRCTVDAVKSQHINFEYSHGNDRVIAYTKDNAVKVVINVSDNAVSIDVAAEDILFENRFNNNALLPEGVIIFKVK